MNWMIVQILWFICESILRQSFIEIIAFALIIIRLINRFWFEKNSFHNKFFVTEIFSNALMTISVGHYESHLIIARRVFGSAKNHLDRRGQKRTSSSNTWLNAVWSALQEYVYIVSPNRRTITLNVGKLEIWMFWKNWISIIA